MPDCLCISPFGLFKSLLVVFDPPLGIDPIPFGPPAFQLTAAASTSATGQVAGLVTSNPHVALCAAGGVQKSSRDGGAAAQPTPIKRFVFCSSSDSSFKREFGKSRGSVSGGAGVALLSRSVPLFNEPLFNTNTMRPLSVLAGHEPLLEATRES
jgi:hypothetical protein